MCCTTEKCGEFINRSDSMKRTALLIITITILSKLVGFGRELVLAFYYGASNISDVYLISMTIPGTIYAFIANGISTVFIPMYTKTAIEQGTIKADKYTNNLVNILLLICTVLILTGLIFTGPIVKLFALGFEGEILQLAVTFSRITLLGIYLNVLVTVFSAYLQIKGNYAIPASVGFPNNVCIIITIVLSSFGNVMILPCGIIFAAIAQFFFLMPFITRKGFRYKATINIVDPHIKEMFYLAIPVIMGVVVNDVNVIVDKTMASQIYEGGISVLNYAQKLNGFVEGIMIFSIATAMYPLISKLAVQNRISELKKTLSEAITGIAILVVPCTVGVMVLSQPIITMLFGRGAFDENAAVMTANALFFYAIGMTGIGLRSIVSRPFYALHDTKTPMLNAATGMVLNIILNIVLSKLMGISGLALATSISAIVIAMLLIISLRKKLGSLGLNNVLISFLKILLASFVMGFTAKGSFHFLQTYFSQNFSLLVAMAVGATIYFVLIYYAKIKDVDAAVKSIKESLDRKLV